MCRRPGAKGLHILFIAASFPFSHVFILFFSMEGRIPFFLEYALSMDGIWSWENFPNPCNLLYKICILCILGNMVSFQCAHVEYPEHTERRFRSGCKTNLMKDILNMKGSKKLLYPYKDYCSRSIKTSLKEMLERPGFKEVVHRGPIGLKNGTFIDVCNGTIFKSFTDNACNPFFQDKRNIGVMLVVDWFNPFKRTEC